MSRNKLFTMILAAVVLAPLAAVADDPPGYFKIPGTNTTIKFNGFAEMVYVYELTGQTDLSKAGEFYNNPGTIALDGTALTKQSPNSLGFESVYSRFGFQTNTPSDVGVIGARIEGDFNHNVQLAGGTFTNKGDLRVRHAYGTVGDMVLLGQTWSTFIDLNAFPDQQDENPILNLTALRAPQIRFSFPAGPAKISLAAENPYAFIGSVPGKYWLIPDFIGKVEFAVANVGSFSIRALTREFKNAAHAKQGFGGAVGAALNFGGDTLVFDASAGLGMGPYMTGAGVADAVDTATEIKLATTYGASVGYTHVWTPKFRSNLMVGGVMVADDADNQLVQAAANGNKQIASGAINTYWSFASNAWVGVEFWYNYRKTFVGDYGHEFRGELTTHFNFF